MRRGREGAGGPQGEGPPRPRANLLLQPQPVCPAKFNANSPGVLWAERFLPADAHISPVLPGEAVELPDHFPDGEVETSKPSAAFSLRSSSLELSIARPPGEIPVPVLSVVWQPSQGLLGPNQPFALTVSCVSKVSPVT